jgi:hypothetical protein
MLLVQNYCEEETKQIRASRIRGSSLDALCRRCEVRARLSTITSMQSTPQYHGICISGLRCVIVVNRGVLNPALLHSKIVYGPNARRIRRRISKRGIAADASKTNPGVADQNIFVTVRDFKSMCAILAAMNLKTSPLALFCPFCGAKPKHDCMAIEGGRAAVHVLRIKAAALTDFKISRFA